MSGNPDLKIDSGLLNDSSVSLNIIYTVLDTLKSRADRHQSDWGAGAIKDAMGNFVGDWDAHREKIMGSVQSMKSMVDQAIQQFDATETDLSHSLQQTTTTSKVRAQ